MNLDIYKIIFSNLDLQQQEYRTCFFRNFTLDRSNFEKLALADDASNDVWELNKRDSKKHADVTTNVSPKYFCRKSLNKNRSIFKISSSSSLIWDEFIVLVFPDQTSLLLSFGFFVWDNCICNLFFSLEMLPKFGTLN